jgi:4'-phosphopantetheinyl transferase
MGTGTVAMIGNGEVHVWTIVLDLEPAAVSSLLAGLSGEERTRAARLRTTELRLRFVAAHGALRSILARYTGLPAGAIPIETATGGKPFIRDAHISFNLSHSDGLAICALTWDAQVGADVERLRMVPDADSIVSRYFAQGEARSYGELAAGVRKEAFFSTWTRKEAFVKGIGDGLQCPLDSFEVEITPECQAPRITTPPHHGHWHLRSFTPAPGYIAAVALDRPIAACHWFTFDQDRSADAAESLSLRMPGSR